MKEPTDIQQIHQALDEQVGNNDKADEVQSK